MNRMSLAAAGWTLSCLLAACGGGADTPSSSAQEAAQAANARTEAAQSLLRREAQAAPTREQAEQFTPGLREIDDSVVWQQAELTVADVAQQRSYADVVTAVDADGNFTFERRTATGVAFERYQSNADGNRLSRDILGNGNHCTYDPNRNFVSFPLHVGKVWGSQWNYSCTLGYRETANQLAAVTARETITVPAGSYDALRIRYATLFTRSNDVNLQNGSTGEAIYLQEATCWWATSVKRIVKCSYGNTFFGSTPPAGYLKSYTLEASHVGKQQYLPQARQVGQSSRWLDTDTLVNGTLVTRTSVQTVTAVEPDGRYTVDRVEANGWMSERYQHDLGGNRLTRFIASSNNNCAYTPRRDYLDFPLYLGKTWNSTWHYGCALGYQEDASHSATVEALETVTTAAGPYKALRIRFQTVLSNSNDFQLENGSIGQATYTNNGVCWWAVEAKRIVKCEIDNTYNGAVPGTYRQRIVTEVAATLVR